MTAGHEQLKARVDQLNLSYTGYKRQLERLDLSPERRERLENEIGLLEEEIATFQKVIQVSRVEPDAERVAEIVRERLAAVRGAMGADAALAHLSPEERDSASGEVKALRWILGEDPVARDLRALMDGYTLSDPTRADRVLPHLLSRIIKEGETVEARASAAYEAGKTRRQEAIPSLAAALGDDALVADIALRALCAFTDDELRQADLPPAVLQRVAERRQAPDQ